MSLGRKTLLPTDTPYTWTC